MTTPADWYPDPEDPAGLRYWDGSSWTEHRTPAAPPPPPTPAEPPPPPAPPAPPPVPPVSEQPTSVPDEPHHGAHRVPDAGAEPVAQSYTPTPAQPYDTHPTTSYEAPPSYEPPSWQQSYEPSSFAPPTEPPTGTPGEGPNKKLVFGIIGGAAAILIAIVVVLVVVVIRKEEPTVVASPGTSSSKTSTTSSETTTSEPEPSATESTTPPPAGATGSDGDYSFAIVSTETGDTITSTVSDSVETSADGMYYVVHLNVTNTGTAPLTFVASFQALNAAGQTFPLDDTATAFLGGTVANVDPGAQVETALVYDVPVGTEPDSILLKADPSTAGIELPLR